MIIKPGRLGKNLELNDKRKAIEGYHLYNPITKKDAFYDRSGDKFRTFMTLNKGQIEDLFENNNIM